jgi:hypothetical protein
MKNLLKKSKPINFSPLLQNKVVLYFTLFVSIAYIFFFLQTGDFQSVFVFLCIGFITTFFSDNMIVVLLCALVGTHLILIITKVQEGLEGGKGAKGDKGAKVDKDNKDVKDAEDTKQSQQSQQSKQNDGEPKKDSGKSDSDNKDNTNFEQDDEFGGMTPEEVKDVLRKRKDIQDDLKGILGLQDQIMKGVKDMEPLMNQADSFMKKYEYFGKITQRFNEK